MKKIFYLLILIIIFTGCSSNKTPANNQGQNTSDNDFYCESDDECVPFVYECGWCADYSIAINKKFVGKYIDSYFVKCKEMRMCESLPRGSSECRDDRCILIK